MFTVEYRSGLEKNSQSNNARRFYFRSVL